MRAPAQLRFVLVTRRDLRLGLPRLRFEGDVTEIRGEDLRFSLDESRALLEAAGVRPSDWALDCCTRALRDGRRGCGWRRCRWPATRITTGSRQSSSAVTRSVAEYLLDEVLER